MSLMLDEIKQTPSVLRAMFQNNIDVLGELSAVFRSKNFRKIVVAARGSSMNAGFCLKNLVETAHPNLTVSFELPSIPNHYGIIRDFRDTLYVVVSQSGASVDTVSMLENAKKSGATVVAVTNNSESPAAKSAHYHIFLSAGLEKAVAATKTFTTELFAMLLLSYAIDGNVNDFDINYFVEQAKAVVDEKQSGEIVAPKELQSASGVLALSRGLTEGIAKECGLKLMECCYKFVYTGSTNEFHHGPKALIGQGQPVVLIAPSGSENGFSDDYIKTAEFLKSVGAYLITITDIDEVARISDYSVKIPPQKGKVELITATLAVQLLVHSLAVSLGLNPDAPRNLNKITITK